MVLSEHVIVMDKGRIMQQGHPQDIYSRPANRFVAEFIGRSNWFEGRLLGKTLNNLSQFGLAAGGVLKVAAQAADMLVDSMICVRPERISVEISDGRPAAESAVEQGNDNVLSGKIAESQFAGAEVTYWVDLDIGARIVSVENYAGQALGHPGQRVDVRFAPDSCICVP
jgi:putative spermidine/putrescine transport system ATP-binding protein/putrescine transport system ATP-binding protein